MIENNYRVRFKGPLQIDYWKDFERAKRVYMADVINLRNIINQHCQYSWFFFEPHVELTWMDELEENCQTALKAVKEYLEICGWEYEIQKPPEKFVDWYNCGSELETEFGGILHHHCADIATEFWAYRGAVGEGKGPHNQMRRTIHRLTNPLCMNYYDEGKMCLAHGLRTLFLCLLIKLKVKDPLKWANKFGNLISSGY